MTKRCLGCKAEMDPDAVFCNECGLAAVSASSVNIASDPVFGSASDHPWQYQAPSPGTTGPVVTDPDRSSTVEPADASQLFADSVMRRYREGYLHARFVNGFGAFVIVVGIILGAITVIAGIATGVGIEGAASRSPFSTGQGAGVLLGGLIAGIGVLIALIAAVIGVLIRAGAQHLKATFDGAVNSSPFLTDLQRAQMMSLRGAGTFAPSNLQSDDRAETGQDNVKAVAAYGLAFALGVLWVVVPVLLYALSPPKDRFLRFHAMQSILLTTFLFGINLLWGGLNLLAAAANSSTLVAFGGLVSIALWIVAIIIHGVCMWKASQKEEFRLPFIGDIAMNFVEKRLVDPAYQGTRTV